MHGAEINFAPEQKVQAEQPAGSPTAAAIIGLLEAVEDQLENIVNDLDGSWEFVGVGRDDGDEEGEYNPILYESDVLELIHSEAKWLSSTHDYVWAGGGKQGQSFTVARYEVADNLVNDIYISDHKLVLADVVINI
ncbi:hypothetical protein BROUX41_004414 [Berkeleyomyces rouxiae]